MTINSDGAITTPAQRINLPLPSPTATRRYQLTQFDPELVLTWEPEGFSSDLQSSEYAALNLTSGFHQIRYSRGSHGLRLAGSSTSGAMLTGDALAPNSLGSRFELTLVPSATTVPIPGSQPSQVMPAAAFNGTNYLVAWFEATSAGGQTRYALRASRLSATGKILDEPSLLIAAAQPFVSPPTVAASDYNFVVAWSDSAIVKAARVTHDGRLLDPGGLVVSSRSGESGRPKAAATGDRLVVVWHEKVLDAGDYTRTAWFRDMHPPDLQRLSGEVGQGAQYNPVVAPINRDTHTSEFLAIMVHQSQDPGSVDLVGFVDGPFPSFQPIASGIAADFSTYRAASVEMALASSGTNFLVAWNLPTSPGNVQVAQFKQGIQPAQPASVQMDGVVSDAAWTGSEYLVTMNSDFAVASERLVLRMRPGSTETELFSPIPSASRSNSPAIFEKRILRVESGPPNEALFIYETAGTPRQIRARRYFSVAPPVKIEDVQMAYGNAELQWTSEPGAVYVIEGRSSLQSGDWTTITDPIVADSSVTSYRLADSAAAAMRFYRVRQEAAP